MCSILQALRAAEAIAAQRELPRDTIVRADHWGFTIQATFPDAADVARHLELHRHEGDDFQSEAKPHHEAKSFTVWGGAYQNIPLTLIDVQPLDSEAVAS